FIPGRPDKHRVHEQRVIWTGADHANLHPVFRVPARETIETVEALAGIQIVKGALAINLESTLVERDVYGPPPHILFGFWMFYDTLVFGGASGFCPRIGHERAVLGDARVLLEADGLFVKGTGRQIVMNFGDGETMVFKIECAHNCCGLDFSLALGPVSLRK